MALPLLFRYRVDARHCAHAHPRRNWRRVHSRYLPNTDPLFARFGQRRTRNRIDVGEISRCHSQDDEFAILLRLLWCVEWLCFENVDCASDVPKRVRHASARNGRTTGGSRVRRSLRFMFLNNAELVEDAVTNITGNITELSARTSLTH